MAPLPPEIEARLKARYAELMQPLDLDAELRRIDARRVCLNRQMDEMLRQAVEPQQAAARGTWWSRWWPAFAVIGGMAAGAALFAAGMLAASRMPPGRPDDGSLALVLVALFFVCLAIVSARR